ncbi:hypothetical protein E4U56_007104, partial [Claviceps arundinis]
SIAEAASIVIQQEVLEFVCGRLEAFKSAPVKDQIARRLDSDNAGLYRTRFQQAEWANILNIVQWYMGPEFRSEWPRPEESRPGDVSHLVDVTIQNLKDMTNLAGDKTLYNKLSSASFRDKLTNFLGEQCGAGEASSPSGPTTDEKNTDAESVASVSILTTRSCSTSDRRQVSAGTDVGGEEEELPSFVLAPDPSLVFDEAMAKAEEQTALSMPSTAGVESTQQEAPDRHRQAQPPFSPQSSCSGPGLAPSGQLAMKTTRSRTTKKNRSGGLEARPEG